MKRVESSNVTELLNEIQDKVMVYSDFKDAIIENDFFELLNDNIALFRGLNSLDKLIQKKRLIWFLKGFTNDSEKNAKRLNKLYDYIKNEQTAEIISNVINKALKSHSYKSSYLLGLIANNFINDDNAFSYVELITVNGLSELYDFDLDNLVIINDFLMRLDSEVSRNGWFDLGKQFMKWTEENEVVIDKSLFLTVEKCVSLQLLFKEYDSTVDRGEYGIDSYDVDTEESYYFTEAGTVIRDNLKYLEYVV